VHAGSDLRLIDIHFYLEEMAWKTQARMALVFAIIALPSMIESAIGALPGDLYITEFQQQASNVWVYTLVGTDYDGYKMLPHFLAHYSSMGVPISNFHFDLLHDPAESDMGLQAALSFLGKLNASWSVASQPYTPAMQDVRMMEGLYRMEIPPFDWIIVADADELFTYGHPTLREATAALEAEGATFALGEMLDHVSLDGKLTELKASPNVWQQYPLVCPVISEVAKGLPVKVTIHRGFLRVGAGHHHIVDPELAGTYFSEQCTGLQCEIVMKKYKQRSTVNIYKKTPYYRYRDSYHHVRKVTRRMGSSGNGPIEWVAQQWSKWAKVHHFKWHAGIITNLQKRNSRDSGNCILGVNEDTCIPNFQFWQEVARQFSALSSGGLNLTKMECKEGIETFWNWK